MKQRNITVTIVPDKRRIKNDVTYPLKLRVTYKGKRKYYATGYNARLNDYSLIMENKARGELRKTSLALSEIQINARKCCDSLARFSFLKFETLFFPKKVIVRQLLSYFLDELTNNINDHSEAEQGYVFAQFYPNSNYLDLCICDADKGIYQSFLDNPKFNPANDIEAMQLTLSGNSTKERPEARGFGISTTRDMLVNGLKGILFLWSGNTTFLQAVNKEAIVNIGENGYFQGTFVALRLPTIIPGDFNFYNFVE